MTVALGEVWDYVWAQEINPVKNGQVCSWWWWAVNCVRPGSVQLQREAGELGWHPTNGGTSLGIWSADRQVAFRGCLVTCRGDSVMGKFYIFFMQANHDSKFDTFFIFIFLCLLHFKSMLDIVIKLLLLRNATCNVLRQALHVYHTI